jgi:hypothetical protein
MDVRCDPYKMPISISCSCSNVIQPQSGLAAFTRAEPTNRLAFDADYRQIQRPDVVGDADGLVALV